MLFWPDVQRLNVVKLIHHFGRANILERVHAAASRLQMVAFLRLRLPCKAIKWLIPIRDGPC